ncbi:tyrosine-type recombinase/integrase [Fructilactobacillus frigidiflavus]|uniref:tyrosine-type recombinase/integrase n=1 Tax=Fructilactobacillus frigidiflavus TaxID=3242688 RepID=UPI0037579A55
MAISQYVDKKGNKFYKIQVYLGKDPQTGRDKRTTLRGFKTKTQAKNASIQAKLDFINGKQKKPQNRTFKEVYKDWYESYKLTVRESTIARTAGMFNNHILKAFGDKRINTITTSDVQRAINKWYKITDRNYKKWFNYTGLVFKYAIKTKIITENPCSMVTIPRKQQKYGKKKINFWDINQLNKFMNCIDPDKELEKYTLFRVLAYSGMRRGELLALKWQDINFSKSTIDINKTVAQGYGGKQIIQRTKTNAGYRTITMDKITMKYLKNWRVAQKKLYMMYGFNTMNKSQLVFSNSKNKLKSLNTPLKWLNAIIEKNGLAKITIHGFRHTHATILASNGASVKEVQDRLGHDDVKTTLQVYTHISEDDRRKTSQIFSDAMDG